MRLRRLLSSTERLSSSIFGLLTRHGRGRRWADWSRSQQADTRVKLRRTEGGRESRSRRFGGSRLPSGLDALDAQLLDFKSASRTQHHIVTVVGNPSAIIDISESANIVLGCGGVRSASTAMSSIDR